MTITEVPQRAAPDTPVSDPPFTVSSAPRPVSGTAQSISPPPSDTKRNAPDGPDAAGNTMMRVLMPVLYTVAVAGGITIGAIGFTMSYDTLSRVALTWGFSKGLAPWFPVGVDASIVTFLAMDLAMLRKGAPYPALRLAAHVMTFATVWFNASSQGDVLADPVKSASHGAMPFLFVLGVEAGRRLLIHKARMESEEESDRVPVSRWVLAPVATARLFRRMKLYGITSYPEMVRRDQDLIGYKQWLKRTYDGDLAKASEDELLPMTMAPYGYTVAQALALPEQQERDAEKRAEEAEQRRLDAATRRELAAKQAEAARLVGQGQLEAVRARVEGETGQAQAHARAQVSAAQRAAELEEAALETAVIAEARAREAEAERKAAQERELEAEADLHAAELERQAAQKRKEVAEANQVAAAEAQAIETQTIAEARLATAEANRVAAETEKAAAETLRRAAEADRQVAEEKKRLALADAAVQDARKREAETELAAAEVRLAASEIERRAVEAEDAAKLTPRERAVRKVARMIQGQIDGHRGEVQLADIQRELAVSSTDTASKYRQEALDLLREGYRPGQ